MTKGKGDDHVVRWRWFPSRAAFEVEPGSYVGGQDPKMNSCIPSHLRFYRSNCDGKVIKDKLGPSLYATKGGVVQYCLKEEKKSGVFADLLKKQMEARGGDEWKRPETPFRSCLYTCYNRDFSAQEVAAHLLGHPIVDVPGFNFPRLNWDMKGPNEVVVGQERKNSMFKTRVEVKWNSAELYFQRILILREERDTKLQDLQNKAAKRKRVTPATEEMDRKARADAKNYYNAMRFHVQDLCFLEFWKQFEVEYQKTVALTGSQDSSIARRYKFIPVRSPLRQIPVCTPQIPEQCRKTSDPKFSEYARVQLSVLKPYHRDPDLPDDHPDVMDPVNLLLQIPLGVAHDSTRSDHAVMQEASQKGLTYKDVERTKIQAMRREKMEQSKAPTAGDEVGGMDEAAKVEPDPGNSKEAEVGACLVWWLPCQCFTSAIESPGRSLLCRLP